MSYEIYMLPYLIFLSTILRKRALEFSKKLLFSRHLIEFNMVWVRLWLSVPKEKPFQLGILNYIACCVQGGGYLSSRMTYFRMNYKY